jgi:drug/metabolite transporter (DMT)-like permease
VAEAAPTRRAHAAAGVALIVAASMGFAALDSSVRWLGAALPVLLMLWWRYATQAALMAAWLALDRGRGFRPRQPRFQALRGALLLATSVFNFVGLQWLPVAEFTAIVMLSPMVATLLAAWLLRERVGPLRWVLVTLAFAGALVVVRPGSGQFGWAVAFPLGSAATYAAFQVLTRRMSGHDDPLVTHFWTGLFGTVAVLPALALFGAGAAAQALAAATPAVWTGLVAIGLLGTFGHLLLIFAFRFGAASTLAPFTYTQIGWAMLFGWLLMGALPDAAAWAGIAMIAVSGAATAWLNVRGGR